MSSVTAILGVQDVNFTTPLSSCNHLIQNTVLCRRTHREKRKEQALKEQGEGYDVT